MKAFLEALAAAMPRIVAGMLAAAALLAAIMAVMAPINDRPDLWRGPPDEFGHRAAARYYVDNWLPPRVGDPATLDSYSLDYGFSYINDPDLAYPLAGKFARLISPVVPDVNLGFRLFNVSLLVLLAVLCFLRPACWPLFVPLLLSPQAWYIFSYFTEMPFRCSSAWSWPSRWSIPQAGSTASSTSRDCCAAGQGRSSSARSWRCCSCRRRTTSPSWRSCRP